MAVSLMVKQFAVPVELIHALVHSMGLEEKERGSETRTARALVWEMKKRGWKVENKAQAANIAMAVYGFWQSWTESAWKLVCWRSLECPLRWLDGYRVFMFVSASIGIHVTKHSADITLYILCMAPQTPYMCLCISHTLDAFPWVWSKALISQASNPVFVYEKRLDGVSSRFSVIWWCWLLLLPGLMFYWLANLFHTHDDCNRIFYFNEYIYFKSVCKSPIGFAPFSHVFDQFTQNSGRKSADFFPCTLHSLAFLPFSTHEIPFSACIMVSFFPIISVFERHIPFLCDWKWHTQKHFFSEPSFSSAILPRPCVTPLLSPSSYLSQRNGWKMTM